MDKNQQQLWNGIKFVVLLIWAYFEYFLIFLKLKKKKLYSFGLSQAEGHPEPTLPLPPPEKPQKKN